MAMALELCQLLNKEHSSSSKPAKLLATRMAGFYNLLPAQTGPRFHGAR